MLWFHELGGDGTISSAWALVGDEHTQAIHSGKRDPQGLRSLDPPWSWELVVKLVPRPCLSPTPRKDFAGLDGRIDIWNPAAAGLFKGIKSCTWF